MSERELDLVLYGASGFVGRLLAAEVAGRAPDGLRVALAGRSAERLHAVRDGLGPRAAGWPVLTADAADDDALAALARRTRLVVSTVGPYTRHGLPLVTACAAAGTDYADLTGEVLFVRRSIDAAHATAERTGARLVHSCGFDSVPSDLAVLLAADRAAEEGLGGLGRTTLLLTGARGGVSGGTVDSARVQVDEARRDRAARRLVADPYALSPDRGREPDGGTPTPDERDDLRPRHEPDVGGWTAPFVMGSHNTRIVRRSNALTGFAYGPGLRYRERVLTGTGLLAPVSAAGQAAGLAALLAGLAVPPSRALLDRVLPSPGDGPGEQARRDGFFRMRLHAGTQGGRPVRVDVGAQGDPGYAATAVMLAESALALLLDRDRLPGRAGVLTPATALGHVLVGRLRERGFTLATR